VMKAAPDVSEGTNVFDLGLAREVLVDGRAIVAAGPNDASVLIVATRRGVLAMQNSCPHLGLPLDRASFHRRYLTCAFHGREYDVKSGACRGGGHKPATPPLLMHRAWIDQDHLFLALRIGAS
jgi:nitrite reductase/ring-hydroxylating ferredoxin subunit